MVRLPGCILLDLDGTILDSLPGIEGSVRAAFSVCGLPAPQVGLRAIVGPPIRTILARAGEITDEATLDALERAFREDYDSKGWQETICFPEAGRVLQRMHARGHRLFVVTNKPRSVSLRILEKEGILQLFEAIVTRDSRRPPYGGKEEMIGSLLSERALAPKECVMVGDTIEDARAAAQVGIGFICMSHGYGTVDPVSVPLVCRLASFTQFLALMGEELVRD